MKRGLCDGRVFGGFDLRDYEARTGESVCLWVTVRVCVYVRVCVCV